MFASLLKKKKPHGSSTKNRPRLPEEDKLATSGGGEGRPARATAGLLSKVAPDFTQDVAHLPPDPVWLCFAHGADEWCGEITPGPRRQTVTRSLDALQETLRRELPSLATATASPPAAERITAVREGPHGPLYPLALLAAAPSLFAPPTSTEFRLIRWVVTIAARPDEPFANHSDPSDVVS